MDLLERYLQAVKFFLPRKQQDDIVRELSENLLSQIEDRQEALERPLNESELADLLRQHGHPMLVAGRYRSRQQLIGPVFFPIYLFAVQAGLAVALLVTVVLALINSALHGEPVQQGVRAMIEYPGRALMVFAWTTLGFAALDFAQSKLHLSGNWDPRSLPKVIKHEYQIPRSRTICELLLVGAWGVWLVLVPGSPFLILGPVAALVEFAPIWRQVYVTTVLLTLATAALHAVNFIRPYWTSTRSMMRLAIHGASLVLLAFLLNASDLFVPLHGVAGSPDRLQIERVVDVINASFHIGFIVTMIITVVEIAKELHRMRSRRTVENSKVLSF